MKQKMIKALNIPKTRWGGNRDMSNVEIVIKIDDKLYNRIKYLESKTTSTLDELMRSVRNEQ